jgi:hypothetical protein
VTGPDWPGRAKSGNKLTGEQRDRIIKPLEYAKDLDPEKATREVYWVLELHDGDAECLCFDTHDGKCLNKVEDVYREMMHKTGGKTEFVAVEDSFEQNDMRDDWKPGQIPAGLGQCLDIMFLGLCHSENDVWTPQGQRDWGCALLATMGPNTETMFLTVIHAEEAIQKLWNFVSMAFISHDVSNNIVMRWTKP